MMMNFRASSHTEAEQMESLFTSAFKDSEGEAEGAIIGKLSKDLFETTAAKDLHAFVAAEGQEITGCILATRMPSAKENDIFLIAPVAVLTRYQGQGVGQSLMRYGIKVLKTNGVKILVTYGDPNFYSKVGFAPVEPRLIEPPFPLSQPEGWLAQTCDGHSVSLRLGKCACVPAFNHPAYW